MESRGLGLSCPVVAGAWLGSVESVSEMGWDSPYDCGSSREASTASETLSHMRLCLAHNTEPGKAGVTCVAGADDKGKQLQRCPRSHQGLRLSFWTPKGPWDTPSGMEGKLLVGVKASLGVALYWTWNQSDLSWISWVWVCHSVIVSLVISKLDETWTCFLSPS